MTDRVDYEELLPHEFEDRLARRVGEEPRDATAEFGESLIEATLKLIGARLDELGV